MNRSAHQKGECAAGVNLSAHGFSDSAVIRKVCEIEPLAPEEQQQHLIEIRHATRLLRAEIALFPGVLGLLLQRDFPAGDFSEREKMTCALEETRALWLQRDVPNWRENYERQLHRNATLALRAFEELFDLSNRPYADVMAIEQQVRQLCCGALAERPFDGASGVTGDPARYEELALRPFEDIRRTAERIRDIDKSVESNRKIMVESNLRLVAGEVSSFKAQRGSNGLDMPGALDLFQEGVIGLMAAIERFLPELGLQFSTYAVHWIRQSIFKYQSGETLISVPRYAKALVAREDTIRQERINATGTVPCEDEVIEQMNLSPGEYQLWCRAKRVVFEGPVRTMFGKEVNKLDLEAADLDGDRRLEEAREAANQISRVLPRLFEGKILSVMTRRFMTASEGRVHDQIPTLAQLAKELGLSRQRASQIEQIGIALVSDFFIVESRRASVRAEVLSRVCSAEERRVIEDLVADPFSSTVAKGTQSRVLTVCATALMAAEVGREAWHSFAAAAGLSPLQAFVVCDRVIEGNASFHVVANRAVAAGLAGERFGSMEAEKVFSVSMRRLAPFARAEFKRRQKSE